MRSRQCMQEALRLTSLPSSLPPILQHFKPRCPRLGPLHSSSRNGSLNLSLELIHSLNPLPPAVVSLNNMAHDRSRSSRSETLPIPRAHRLRPGLQPDLHHERILTLPLEVLRITIAHPVATVVPQDSTYQRNRPVQPTYSLPRLSLRMLNKQQPRKVLVTVRRL